MKRILLILTLLGLLCPFIAQADSSYPYGPYSTSGGVLLSPPQHKFMGLSNSGTFGFIDDFFGAKTPSATWNIDGSWTFNTPTTFTSSVILGPVAFPAYPYASLPVAPASGTFAIVTDTIRGLFVYYANQWFSLTFDYVDVKWFGAKGNGSTDDTAAINLAIGAANTAGCGTVKFHLGNYRVTGLTLTDKCVNLDGMGTAFSVGATTISSVTNAPIVFYTRANLTVPAPGGNSQMSAVSNLAIVGAVGAGTSQHCLQIDNLTLRITNVLAMACGGQGFYGTDSVGTIFDNAIAEGTNLDGFRLEAGGAPGVYACNSNRFTNTFATSAGAYGYNIAACFSNTGTGMIEQNSGTAGLAIGNGYGYGFGNRFQFSYIGPAGAVPSITAAGGTKGNRVEIAAYYPSTHAISDGGTFNAFPATSAEAGHAVAPGDTFGTDTSGWTGVPNVVAGVWGVGAVGVFTTPTFNAANFTASSSMTWTVGSTNIVTNEYTVIGKKMTVIFDCSGGGITTVGGTPDYVLYMAIPGGYTAAKAASAYAQTFDGTNYNTGRINVLAGGTVINFHHDTGESKWLAASTYIRGELTFEVQ